MAKIPGAEALGVVEPKFTGADRVSIGAGEMSAIAAPARAMSELGGEIARIVADRQC